MIRLLEPQRPPGFVSGGYRYQAEVGQRLARRGIGELQVVAPADLDALVAAHTADTIVVDGLFVERTRRPLPAGVIALLHAVPSLTPWAAVPLPAIVTGASTGAAVAADASGVEVVRPGVNACFRPGPAAARGTRRRVVCTGTVWPGKGQLLLAQALATTVDAASIDLVLLGDHRMDPDFARAVAAAAAPCAPELHGVCTPEEVAAQLHRAQLYVSASRDESFGMAVAEAVACGVPVLAFATGEIPTFVQHGRNGWLVPSPADDDTFAAQLRAVLADAAGLLRARAATAAPSFASWDEVTDRFVAACERFAGH